LFAVRAYLRHNSPPGHLNPGIDGIFEIVRVVGRNLGSITEVHAIVARAYLAQSEPRWRAIDLAFWSVMNISGGRHRLFGQFCGPL